MKLFDLADLSRGPGARLLDATVALGFSPEVARAGLKTETDAWLARGAVEGVLAELPPDLPAARLPRRVLIIAARTLPASTMRSVLMARLLGAEVLLKPARGQEAVAEAIAAADPAVRARYFPPGDAETRRDAIARAESVVVLGSDATVAALRAEVPEDKAYTGYGHRLSVAWLDRADDEALAGLATDLCAWDQAGCLSPQVAWTAEDPEAVAPRLADALREAERALPMTLPAEALRAREVAASLAEMTGVLERTATALVMALPDAPTFRPSPGFRAIWLLPASGASLSPIRPHLSTVAYAGGTPPDAPRVCAPGEMQRPPLGWQHDGRPNLLPLLRPAR